MRLPSPRIRGCLFGQFGAVTRWRSCRWEKKKLLEECKAEPLVWGRWFLDPG